MKVYQKYVGALIELLLKVHEPWSAMFCLC